MNFGQGRSSFLGSIPTVVKNLLIINVLLFLGTIGLETIRIDLVQYLGLHFPGSEHFYPYQFISYMFMHGGFSHVFFNMFALWMFGRVLEQVWGPKRFLIYYMITGIGAALIHFSIQYIEMAPTLASINNFISDPELRKVQAFFNSETFKVIPSNVHHFEKFRNTYNALVNNNQEQALQVAVNFFHQYRIDYMNAHVVIGASGSVFGVLLAFGMMFPNMELFLLFPPIPIKAKYMVIGYGAIELIYGVSNRPGDNVAHFAHLGGMLFGFILVWYWKKKGEISRYN